MTVQSGIARLVRTPGIAEAVAFLGGLLYIFQSWNYAHTRTSILDEGAYLLKGYYFVTGQFRLFQDNGFWSNHMPLAFYIPGVAEYLFGPGIRTGRYLAIFVGLLGLAGLYILIRRLGGPWWAAIVIWALAINPVTIKIFSVAVSEGLVACMLVWMLVFLLGAERKSWQIILGSLLAGIIVMTRENMLPILPLVALYIFWEHGYKLGLLAIICISLPVILGHWLFWPGILRIWAYWLPGPFSAWLSPWLPPAGQPAWDPDVPLAGRAASFFLSFRVSFVALSGAFAAFLLWPKRQSWKRSADFRSAVFLSLLFISLLLAHMWATLTKNYCVYCLPGYTTFFAVAGLALLVLTFGIWRKELPGWYQVVLALFILGLAAGIGYGAYEDTGNILLSLPVPRALISHTLEPGTIELRRWLTPFSKLDVGDLRRILPTLAGFLAGFAVLGLAALSHYVLGRRGVRGYSFGYLAVVIFLGAGFLFSPSLALAGGYQFYECSGDTLRTYEDAGSYLAGVIPPGARVYWKGGLSVVPLLYIPGVKIYPAQVNGTYSYVIGGDPAELSRYGFWNEQMAKDWLDQTDYILVQEKYYSNLAGLFNFNGFEELQPSPPVVTCEDGARIRIFRRID